MMGVGRDGSGMVFLKGLDYLRAESELEKSHCTVVSVFVSSLYGHDARIWALTSRLMIP